MPRLDKRFALLRNGERWYAAPIEPIDGGAPTFRVSGNGTRDAHGEPEHLTDLREAARRVLVQRLRIRFAPESGKRPTSLYTRSKGVTGYELDPAIAHALGMPPRGTF